MLAIGLMSGTSLDGVDAALVRIENDRFDLVKFITLDYEQPFKSKIMRNLYPETARLDEICSLNFELGYKFLEAVDKLLEETPYQYEDIAFVASHGQTIWHNPKQGNGNIPSTLQIGEPSVITYQTNIPVVSDFRTMDMAAGGEGAPLVPMSEYMIFRSDTENRILQNIGGVSNLTYLPKHASISDVTAFDTGPGNIMIDFFTSRYFGMPYDDGGKIALSGTVIKEVMDFLKQDEFITRIPPKSTGREQYNRNFMEKMAEELRFDHYRKADIVATITEFTVYAMIYHYRHFIREFDTVILSGGGSHNQYIEQRMKENLSEKVITQEDIGYNSDAKEAVAFACLGYLTLCGRPGNVIKATGAEKETVLGKITPGNRGLKKWQLI